MRGIYDCIYKKLRYFMRKQNKSNVLRKNMAKTLLTKGKTIPFFTP